MEQVLVLGSPSNAQHLLQRINFRLMPSNPPEARGRRLQRNVH
ncbi:hypothetical protein SAMN06296416_101734 [Pseudoxanthomonas wuyuanensis]|uniref:Uncharacterized protein n=1 Tax=Pseudoxanthomonas wuyuanensis TaxID=1073196 RepID=A0A286CYY0_9GAMM|nr:hypothetical protein SAMN06296416_101734 [Pseudoxanthomonas wuyuanensis]